jgi:hypothetical protein
MTTSWTCCSISQSANPESRDSAKGRITSEDLKRQVSEDQDLLKTIIEETLQQVLED